MEMMEFSTPEDARKAKYLAEKIEADERERCARIVDWYLSKTGRSCAAAAILELIRSGE